MTDTGRRYFLRTACSLTLLCGAQRLATAFPADNAPVQGSPHATNTFPIIDAHIHLYDPRRRGGVPWPERTDIVLYRPALPSRYRRIAAPLGVVGAVAVECSPLEADNDWLLHVAAADTMVVGVIGNLDPAHNDFARKLERLQRHALFRGIRYGNLWGRKLGEGLKSSTFVENLKLLSERGLLMETANPDPRLITNVVELSDRVPGLRIIIDHLPHAVPPMEHAARRKYEDELAELSKRPQVLVKGSELFRRVGDDVVKDLAFYTDWLDQIWGWFGEDRMLFGSDWPNSDHMASYADTLDIVSRYVTPKGPKAAEKFFCKNSIAAYRWNARNPAQAKLLRAFG
ncbi:MAG: L-fuconolactonase [Acidobacteriaceae bacterium]|nr:L-fuconolactonase [Acidobacteriaceae bacterium]